MWATDSSALIRSWSLPMRAPPVRSYIHMALRIAFASFGLMSPPLPNRGSRNGSRWTRWGARVRRRWRS
jgi:hypothetical protein